MSKSKSTKSIPSNLVTREYADEFAERRAQEQYQEGMKAGKLQALMEVKASTQFNQSTQDRTDVITALADVVLDVAHTHRVLRISGMSKDRPTVMCPVTDQERGAIVSVLQQLLAGIEDLTPLRRRLEGQQIRHAVTTTIEPKEKGK